MTEAMERATAALIKRYRSVSLDEIERAVSEIEDSAAAKMLLTGFGCAAACLLCVAAGTEGCDGCVHALAGDDNNQDQCAHGPAQETCDAIYYAQSAMGLGRAYRARADYLERLPKDVKKAS